VGVLGELQAAFGPRLAAFELLSRAVLDVLFRQFPEARDPLPGTPWSALVEFEDVGGGDGETDDQLKAALEGTLGALVERGALADAVIAQTHAQADRLWWLREHVPEAEKREGIAIKHDIALPVSAVPDFVEAAGAALVQAFPGCEVLAFGHLGDGNLHYNVRHTDPAQNPALLERQDAVNRVVYDLVKARNGSISAEHGIGQLKRDLLPDYKSAVEVDLMQRIRAAIDPQGVMNPGKLTGPR
jgi:FAD/FMN-containing dehydrogenase